MRRLLGDRNDLDVPADEYSVTGVIEVLEE